MILNREALREAVEDGLVQDYPHFETQLQPNGFDMTAGEIHSYDSKGRLDFSNDEREIPGSTPLEPEKRDAGDDYGWWSLEPGVYKVVMNETVDLPGDVMAIAFPRSSLLRMGATIENAVWDSGYTGQGEFMLDVRNREGIEVKENARVNQLVFIQIEEVEDGYSGRFHEQ